MKKSIFYLSLFVCGFLFHKIVEEEASYRVSYNYNKCIDSVIDKPWVTGEKSPFQYCFHNLNYNVVEKVLLYRPDMWCRFHTDDLACKL